MRIVINKKCSQRLLIIGVIGCLLYAIGDFLFAATGKGQTTESRQSCPDEDREDHIPGTGMRSDNVSHIIDGKCENDRTENLHLSCFKKLDF